MPEYRLLSETFTVDGVDYADDKNAGVINLDGPEKIMLFKKKNFRGNISVGTMWNVSCLAKRTYDTRAAQIWQKHHFSPRMAAESQARYWHSL